MSDSVPQNSSRSDSHSVAKIQSEGSDSVRTAAPEKVSTLAPNWIMEQGEPRTGSRARPGSITQALNAGAQGDAVARNQAFFALHDELRRMAHARMNGQNGDRLLESLDVVQDLCLRYLGSRTAKHWENREHFLAWASATMRSILVDHARAGMRLRRRARGQRKNLDDILDHIASAAGEYSRLDEAIQGLGVLDPRAAQVAQHRFVLGYTVEEIAANLGMSIRTVERDVCDAKRYLAQELK